MKTIIAALAVAVVATPLFAAEPTLETQKHDSSLMMDGMKSLDSKVEATWVSKEQTESVAKESASILKETEIEIAPAVASAKTALDAERGKLNTALPALPENKESHTAEKVGAAVGGIGMAAAWITLVKAITGNAGNITKALPELTFAVGISALIGYGVVHGAKKIGKWLFN